MTEVRWQEPISVTVSDACKLTGVCRSTIYNLIAAHKLIMIKVGRRSLIRYSSLNDYMKSCEVANV